MDLQAALTHGIDDDGVGVENLDTRADVELDHLDALFRLIEGVKEGEVLLSEGPQRHEPGVDEAELLVAQCGGNTTT